MPNSDLFTHRLLFFSREKPLVKSMAPGSLLYHICLCDLFSFAFIFRSIKPKIQKYFVALYFSCDLFIQSITTFSRPRTNFWHRYAKGIDKPFNTSGCEYLLFVCTCCLLVLLGSPNGSITLVSSLREIPTVVVLLHTFLFGEIPT